MDTTNIKDKPKKLKVSLNIVKLSNNRLILTQHVASGAIDGEKFEVVRRIADSSLIVKIKGESYILETGTAVMEILKKISK